LYHIHMHHIYALSHYALLCDRYMRSEDKKISASDHPHHQIAATVRC